MCQFHSHLIRNHFSFVSSDTLHSIIKVLIFQQNSSEYCLSNALNQPTHVKDMLFSAEILGDLVMTYQASHVLLLGV
jgi:hypothetical protein